MRASNPKKGNATVASWTGTTTINGGRQKSVGMRALIFPISGSQTQKRQLPPKKEPQTLVHAEHFGTSGRYPSQLAAAIVTEPDNDERLVRSGWTRA